ncbi:MAG: nuclear transport factor 2 family protein [Clostridiales bacterium]|nr:nuclear transport factor 2 family protein [Clostridiales bacterium]
MENSRAIIIALAKAYDSAWNRGDVEKLLSFFVSDMIIIKPKGEVTKNMAEFGKGITDLFGGFLKDSIHKTKIIHIHVPKNDVAVVDGEVQLTTKKLEEGNVLTHRYTDVMIKNGDRWLISDIRTYDLIEKNADLGNK